MRVKEKMQFFVWMTALSAMALERPDIYVAFDSPEPLTWENLGAAAPGETPSRIGAVEGPTIAWSENGLRGGAWDGRAFVSCQPANSPVWGTDLEGPADTPIEQVLEGQTAFTIAMWIRTEAFQGQGRLMKTPALHINYRGDHVQVGFGRPVKQWHNSEKQGLFDSINQWLFVAVIYEKQEDAGRLQFYVGDQTGRIQSAGTVETPAYTLHGNESGCWLSIGNSEPDGARPFVGQMDEFRLWAGRSLCEEMLREVCQQSLPEANP